MAIGPGNEVIEDWLTRIKSGSSITLSHDLNIRPAIGLEVHRERARVERLNQISDIIKASDADLEWLYATKIPAELDAVANGWSIEKLVIVSRGEHGVKAFKNGKVFDIPAFKTSLVDTVGAGDTFMASFLAELNQLGHLGKKTSVSEISDEDLVRAMRTASAAASIVCGRTGCLPPTRDEIQQKLANAD
jgi:fructokinase